MNVAYDIYDNPGYYQETRFPQPRIPTRKTLFRNGECVRLEATKDNPEQYGTIVCGNWSEDDVYEDTPMAVVLLFPEYRTPDDDGTYEVPVNQIHKQYE